MNSSSDTICAIATAQGGALGVIRLSGPHSIAITSTIFRPPGPTTSPAGKAALPVGETASTAGEAVHPVGESTLPAGTDCTRHQAKRLENQPAYSLTYGHIVDGEEVIDEVLVSLFRSPRSYTGEESVEISCHGSAYILQRVLQLLISEGARMAQPGEFTQRAFLNGKMDLSQAEAVADLIASTNAATHRMALSQLRGGFSRELQSLRTQLLHFTSLIELELDFSDHEELEFADRSELRQLAQEIDQKLSRLAHSFHVGNALKRGIPVAIIGETNAGKSTLLNALVGEERAIVSDIHGTTRDVIEDCVNLGGVTFRFIDTAGIRQTADTIESLGIERTFQKIAQAEIVLWLIDGPAALKAQEPLNELKARLTPLCEEKQLIILYNKSDLLTEAECQQLSHQFSQLTTPQLTSHEQPLSLTPQLFISAKQQQGLDLLQALLLKSAALPEVTAGDVVVTNLRHYEALTRALEAIRRVEEGLEAQLSGDFIAQDIRECIFHLSDIAGHVTTDDILQNIFSHFCIGK